MIGHVFLNDVPYVHLSLMLLTCVVITGCDSEISYRTHPLSFDLNPCLSPLDTCGDLIANETRHGCYISHVTDAQGDVIQSYAVTFSYNDGQPQFKETQGSQVFTDIGPGQTLMGTMFFYQSEVICDELSMNAICDEPCLLRLKHVPYTLKSGDNLIHFEEGGRCLKQSSTDQVREACINPS